jgi:phosphotransferase system HPr-like phosphotransfer protein
VGEDAEQAVNELSEVLSQEIELDIA